MSMSIEKILDTNNEGVELLNRGRYGAARRMFQSAAIQYKHFYDKKLMNEERVYLPLFIEATPIPSPSKIRRNRHTEHYLYQNALVANPLLSGDVEQDELNFLSPTVMILYNLTLANHLSIERRVKCATGIKKVIRLYEKVLDMIPSRHVTQISALECSSSNCSQIAISLGIMNNIAALYHELGEYCQTRLFLNFLMIAMADVNVPILGEEAYNGMAMNALFLEEPKVAEAA
mmetsp:Transcript_13208/g.20516  ORF Transcript_13208/g.20516 Transcript_13208/m.20516 type:complete len:232 (-) Transcript_13208:277-972(-)